MGLPQVVISDNGSEFNNALDKTLSELLGLKRRLTTPYHPQVRVCITECSNIHAHLHTYTYTYACTHTHTHTQANGLVERFNQTLQTMLAKFVHSKKSMWSTYLDTCIFAYNTSRHDSTQFTPFELMFGRRATLPIDITFRKALPEEVAASIEDPDLSRLMEERAKLLEEVKKNIHTAQEKQKAESMHSLTASKKANLSSRKTSHGRNGGEGSLMRSFLGHTSLTKHYPTEPMISSLMMESTPFEQQELISSHTTNLILHKSLSKQKYVKYCIGHHNSTHNKISVSC